MAMISRIAMRRSKCTASLAIRVTVLNYGPLNGVDAREILGRVRSLPPLPDVQGDGVWLKGCPRTRERAQILDVLGVRIPSAKYELDLPVYLRPQRTVGLTGGVAATQWSYGRHLLAAFSRKIFLHLPGPATACSATIGSKLPLAAFESQRILGRGPERPLSLGCPFLFAGAANGGSPPKTTALRPVPGFRNALCCQLKLRKGRSAKNDKALKLQYFLKAPFRSSRAVG